MARSHINTLAYAVLPMCVCSCVSCSIVFCWLCWGGVRFLVLSRYLRFLTLSNHALRRVTPPHLHIPFHRVCLHAHPCVSLGPCRAWLPHPFWDSRGGRKQPCSRWTCNSSVRSGETAGYCTWCYHGLRPLSASFWLIRGDGGEKLLHVGPPAPMSGLAAPVLVSHRKVGKGTTIQISQVCC